LTALVAVNVLVAVFSVVQGRVRKGALLALTVAALVVSNLPETIAAHWVTATAFACWMLVTAFAIAVSVRYALRQDEVGSDHVYAALSSYLLAGLLFAELYLVLTRAMPGSLAPAGTSTAVALA